MTTEANTRMCHHLVSDFVGKIFLTAKQTENWNIYFVGYKSQDALISQSQSKHPYQFPHLKGSHQNICETHYKVGNVAINGFLIEAG